MSYRQPLLALPWCIVFFGYATVSNRIPVHYNFAGEVDGLKSKERFFILPAVSTFLAVVLVQQVYSLHYSLVPAGLQTSWKAVQKKIARAPASSTQRLVQVSC